MSRDDSQVISNLEVPSNNYKLLIVLLGAGYALLL